MSIKGEPATSEYLKWFDEYLRIVSLMKTLNKSILKFQGIIDDPNQTKVIDTFRRKLIKLQKDYAKSGGILNTL